MSRKLSQAVFHAAIARIGALVCAATVHILALRVLGPAEYGIYILAESIVFVLNIVAIFGTSLSCFSIGDPEHKAHPRILLAAAATLIASLVIAETLLMLALWLIFPGARFSALDWVLLAGATILGLCLYRLISEVIRIAVGVNLANYFSGRGNGFVSSALFVLLVLTRFPNSAEPLAAFDLLVCYAAAQWLGILTAMLLLLPALLRAPTSSESLGIVTTLGEMWQRGRRIVLTQILQTTLVSIDVWMLGILGSPAVLGVYGFAKRCATWLIVPAGMIGLSAMKRAVDEYLSLGRVSTELNSAFRKMTIQSWRVVTALVAIALLIPSAWLAAAGASSVSLSRPFFVGLGVGQIIRLAFGNGGLILSAAGHENENFWAFVRGNAVALAMALLTMPYWGGWGAVATYSAGTITAAVFVSRACRRCMNFSPDFVRV